MLTFSIHHMTFAGMPKAPKRATEGCATMVFHFMMEPDSLVISELYPHTDTLPLIAI